MKFPFWPNPVGYRNIDLGLSRVFQLLQRLGNPHLKLPPTIHIAGTNGKGSTLSFLRQIFAESGLKIHTYTSPHLVNFNERIVVAGQEISDELLNEILTECKIASEQEPKIAVTFFEGITVAAFLAFSRISADLLLLEVGMGGRLDATNVLPEVLASVITPISFDHTDFLGKTLSKIAFEKAGIIKKNCPVIVGKQKLSARKTIENQALKLDCEIKFLGSDWKIKKNKAGFLFTGFGQKISLPQPSLLGKHQIENASVAIATALCQKKFQINEKHIQAALKKTYWPARLQKITSGKFAEILPKNYELYLDGSHNIQGATTILEFIKTKKPAKIIAIFSMLEDKDCTGFLRKISAEIDELIVLKIPNEAKSLKVKTIKKIAEKLVIKTQIANQFKDAFSKVNLSDENVVIIVCGSLYLAGEFLAQNEIT